MACILLSKYFIIVMRSKKNNLVGLTVTDCLIDIWESLQYIRLG